jgi:tetratricopeptide (TPR) repeat protein
VERLKVSAAGQPNALGPRAALVYALVRSGDTSLARAELEKISGSAHPYPLLPELSAFVSRSTSGTTTAPARTETPKREPPPATPAPARRAPEQRGEPESSATDFRVLLERASQATAARQYDRAEQLYRMALVKNPGDTEALGGLGDVARARGNTGLARTYYEQVLAKNPHYLPSLSALADLDWETGDKASAVKRYSDIIAITPIGPLSERARSRIAEASDSRPPKSEPKPATPPAEKPPAPPPPSSDLPPGVDTSDLPGFHR